MQKSNCTYKKVRLFHSIPDLYLELDMWNEISSPLLFVTGLSGSGKTTVSERLSKQYECVCISLDALRFYSDASTESQRAVDEFLLNYPNIAELIQTHWSREGLFCHNEREYARYTRLFVQYIHERAIHEQRRYIVEGIQLFVRLPKEALINQPKIVVGTGALRCFYQATKRTYPVMHPRFLPSLVRRFIRYYVIQFIRLNLYIAFWEKHENLPRVTKIGSQ